MKLIGNSLIYTVVSLLQRALGFFLLPLYTSYLTASDYGTANVITSITGFLSIFYMLSLHGAGTRFEYRHAENPEAAREMWGTLFLFVLANSAVLSTMVFLLRGVLLEPFLGGIPFWPCMALGLAAAALAPAYSLFQSNLQAKQLGRRFGGNNLAYFMVNMGLTVLFITAFGMKAEGILTALALTNLIFFLYTFLDFPRRIALRFSATHLKEAFAYSLPLIPHSLAGWAMGLIDRLFLNHYRDAASVGVYSIGAQFGNLINIATVAVNQAYVPWFFEQFEKGQEGRARIVRASEAMVLAYCACALAVSLFAQEALLLMVSEEFRTGWTVVPPLAFSFVFSGVYFLFVNPLFVRRTAFVPIVTVASGALGVALNMVLVPRFGMAGAAASSLGSMAASSILALILTSMLEPIGFRWVRMYGYVAIAFLLSQAVHLQGLLHPAIFILGKAVLAGATAAAVVLTHRTEAAKVWSIAQARLRRKKGA